MVEKTKVEISRAYLFTGEVDSRRSAAVDNIIGQVVDPAFADFDLEMFDGHTSSAEDIISAAVMVPFASERKVVLVDWVDRLSSEAQEILAAYIPKLGEKSCLILLTGVDAVQQKRKPKSLVGKPPPPKKKDEEDEDEEESEEKKRKKKGLIPELAKAVKKDGRVVTFGKMKAEDLTALISSAVEAQGKNIQGPALHALARSVAANPAVLEREVEKLAAYVGDADSISLADVDKVTTKSPEDRIFPLLDAMAAGRSAAAVRLLNESFAASSKPDQEALRMISMLARHLRILYQAKFLATKGVRHPDSTPEELQALLMREHSPLLGADWQKKKYMEQARQFTLDQIAEYMKQVLACELASKGLGRDGGTPRLNLEMLIVRLSRRSGNEKKGVRE
jgi:DNA polymerase-3 subunit delta